MLCNRDLLRDMAASVASVLLELVGWSSKDLFIFHFRSWICRLAMLQWWVCTHCWGTSPSPTWRTSTHTSRLIVFTENFFLQLHRCDYFRGTFVMRCQRLSTICDSQDYLTTRLAIDMGQDNRILHITGVNSVGSFVSYCYTCGLNRNVTKWERLLLHSSSSHSRTHASIRPCFLLSLSLGF